MEEHFSVDIKATPSRVFSAVVYELTKVERRDTSQSQRWIRRPEGDVGKGTVIEINLQDVIVPLSISIKFTKYNPPTDLKVEMRGMGTSFDIEYSINDSGEFTILKQASRATRVSSYMVFMNWLVGVLYKVFPKLQGDRDKALRVIKELAESDQDLRV